VHSGIESAMCVMHTQTTTGMAVASSAQGLLFGNVYAAQLAGRVAYHQFQGLGINPGEGERLVADIGDQPAVILRNRGLLAWGETLPKAFSTLWALQRACDVQVAGAALGPTVPVPELVQRRSAEEAIKASASPEFGLDVFDALVRQVDRYDTNWRN
jgi:ribulose-5-phosphate 4-epimerase/fuculose-1-phosphate aldolase